MQEQDYSEKLTQTISDIAKFAGKIEDKKFDEAATKQFMVLPILTALGWDYANIDTLEVFPEFRVGSDKVDYALQNEGKPLVFVECKRWNANIEMEEPQDQIARYIFQEGVDLGVVTNGRKMGFLLRVQNPCPVEKQKILHY